MSDSTPTKTQQALLQTLTPVLACNPGASLSEIAKQAGIGRATLYRHFASRDALVKAVAMDAIAAFDQATAEVKVQNLNAGDALLAFLQKVIPLGDRFHFLAIEPAAYNDPEIATAYARQLQELNAFITTLKQAGFIAVDVPKAWVTTAIDSLIWSAWSAVQAGDIAPNDAAALAYRTLIQGLGPLKS
ncbi:MAG: TetR/AcrR family transcriptional regulator [Spirulina sp. SIO3F2]|nr:TetR/AcrR family transcriptional regulator [Spirulina sp. SIO3F2]